MVGFAKSQLLAINVYVYQDMRELTVKLVSNIVLFENFLGNLNSIRYSVLLSYYQLKVCFVVLTCYFFDIVQ